MNAPHLLAEGSSLPPSSRLTVGRDTALCMSLAGRPGTFGSRFHNHLFAALALDYVYKAFTTRDLTAAIAGIRALGIRGSAVSMPFKEACIPLLDGLAPSAAAIASVNTIVNDDGRLTGHNTDYAAIGALLDRHRVPRTLRFALHGSGGMAKAVAAALRDAGFGAGLVVSRNAATGRALAESYGLSYARELGAQRPELLINATPLGMAGGPASSTLSFSREAIDSAQVVLDVVAMPVETPLVAEARGAGIATITGDQVLVLQGAHQFTLYTGRTPSDAQVRAAAEFALS